MENKDNITEDEELEKGDEAAAESTEQAAEPELSEADALRAELAELNDKHLRMAAEYENFRRRSREEKLALYDSAVADAVAELLPMVDNLERATMYDDGAKVKDGLAMTLKALEGSLQRLGISAFGDTGETFDPNLHNAVLHIDDEAYGEGEIVEVLQKGYKKGDKIIRFAMVKTAN